MVLGAFLVALFTPNKRSFIKFRKLELLWVLTLFVPIMSRLMTSYKGNGMFETVGFTVFYVSSMIFALVCARDEKCIRASFKVMTVFLVLLVFCTILFRFTPNMYSNYIAPLFDRMTELRRGYKSGNMAGLTSHYSTNGMYMALAVIIAFCHNLLISNKSKKAYKYRIVLLITLFALLITGKRAHLLFAIAAAVVVYYFYKSDKPRGRVLKILLVVTLGIMLVFCVSLVYPDLFSAFSRLISVDDNGDFTTGRIGMWKEAFDYFIDYPVWGIGFKQFIRIGGLDVHNVFLQLLCETGIVGFLITIIPMAVTAINAIKQLVYVRRKHMYSDCIKKQFYLLFSVCYQAFFFMYCLTGNPWYDLPTLFPYMLCVGITLYFSRDIKSLKKTENALQEVKYGKEF